MKHKLVLIFDDDSEVNEIDKCLLFNNVLDAEHYLLSTSKFKSIKIETDDKYFSFNTGIWTGTGKAFWIKDLT